ncbi:phosphotransferase [soil metagenome]
MDDATQQFLNSRYGWTIPSNVQTIHQGENETFLITTGEGAFVVRRYRRGHRSVAEIAAEVAWLELLRTHLNVPETVATLSGATLCANKGHAFVVFKALPGRSIYHPTPADYERLGALQRELHEAAGELGREQPRTWAGYGRPVYGHETLIDTPLRSLRHAPFLESQVKVQAETIAATLTELYEQLEPSNTGFVHMDMHFGNIIVVGKDWFVLDFDECGFGPRVLDAGAVRFHAVFEGHLGERWQAFVSGYGGLPKASVLLGSALRAFYAAGKVPNRLDVAGLAKNPAGVVRRYLEHVASELSLLR